MAAAAPMVVPRAIGTSSIETLNVACVGVGGMGAGDLSATASGKNVRIVALCDVDSNHLGSAAKDHAGARTFRDYRRMLDAMDKDIDAVVVATPDHMHGSIALAAMGLGKHVYCQKPIAHNLHECREMAALAADTGVVTQMGTQIHSHTAYRTAVAALRTGVIGKVQEAHLWVRKSWGGDVAGRPDKSDVVPDHLDWDLWLGVAKERPYVDGLYHPSQWRRWLDFGSGTLGDMGCHIFDPVFAALGIGAPKSVTSHGPAHFQEMFAPNGDFLYEFPGTDQTAETIQFRWTDGDAEIATEKAQLPEGETLPGAGSFLVGEKGVMVIPHWAAPRFYSNGEKMDVEIETLPSKEHRNEWTDACRGEGETSTPFSYACPLTEAVLLGTVAGHFPGQKLSWNSEAMEFDHYLATALTQRIYRKGWQV
ncbi:Gfo/Idh/MocA family protein [Saltatorellus ferox]